MIRTRFAPSPTGFLHVGGIRTALFSWLAARQATGQFIVRIEDTDRTRHVEESEKHILDSLSWLGLSWDEGPYRQSERLDIYKEWAQRLIDTGRAYADTRTPKELDHVRAQAAGRKKPVLFRENRPDHSPDWKSGMPLRFKSQPKDYQWHDNVMGGLSAGPEAVDDFIILKSDGFPTYNFAHVIDDHLMRISHVIRSQEFLPSIPKFLNLHEALGIDRPIMATLPYVMAPGGQKKLSKRDGAKDVLDYRKDGFLPETLLNFLATLGWNDGSEQEIFSVNELIAKFSLDRVQKSGAHFDQQRLTWMNGHYIRSLPVSKLSALAEDYWPRTAKEATRPYKLAIMELVQERIKYLAELPELTSFFFEEPTSDNISKLYLNPVDKQLRNIDTKLLVNMLRSTAQTLKGSTFSREDIAERLNGLLGQLQTKPGILFAAIRIAVTGSQSSPEIFGTIAVLGKDKVNKRLAETLRILEK